MGQLKSTLEELGWKPFFRAQVRDSAEEHQSPCWLGGRPLGTNIVWDHPIPKSRGGRNGVPMHPMCQQSLIANLTNPELQGPALDVDALLVNPNVRRFLAG